MHAIDEIEETEADEALVTGLTLTRHEVDVLLWTARGKTAREISQIIYRSQATVHYHLRNAITKLDAANKCHAVAKAFARGLLDPGSAVGPL